LYRNVEEQSKEGEKGKELRESSAPGSDSKSILARNQPVQEVSSGEGAKEDDRLLGSRAGRRKSSEALEE